MEPVYYILEPSSHYTATPHNTLQDAEIEAKRLARENIGKTFIVLKTISRIDGHIVLDKQNYKE